MSNNFENILKSKLENLSKPAPEHVLNKLRVHYPKPKFSDYIAQNAIKIAVVSTIITVAIIIAINLFDKTKTKSNTNFQTVEKNNIISISNTIEPVNEQNIKQLNTQNFENSKNINSTYSTKKIIHQKIFNCSDTSICSSEFLLETNIKVENILCSNELTINKLSNGNIKISTSKAGTYYLKYIDETNDKIITDSIKICFANLKAPEIEVIDQIECSGDALRVKVNYDKNTNISWNADGAKIEKINNNEFKFTWHNYVEQDITITASISEQQCICEVSKTIKLPEPISLNTITKPANFNLNNGEILIKSNKENSIYYLDNIKQNTGNFKDLKSGKHKLLIIYDNNCRKELELTVNSGQKLKLNFQHVVDENDPMNLTLKNTSTIDNRPYNTNIDISFTWEIQDETYLGDSKTIKFYNEGEKVIKLKAYYKELCVDSLVQRVNISNDLLLIPNIFSPNGDGISDVFTVKTKNILSFKAIITNTKGEVIYQWDNPDGGWDGYINGNNIAAEGVYFYIIYAEFKSGKKIERKGSLNLVRY